MAFYHRSITSRAFQHFHRGCQTESKGDQKSRNFSFQPRSGAPDVVVWLPLVGFCMSIESDTVEQVKRAASK